MSEYNLEPVVFQCNNNLYLFPACTIISQDNNCYIKEKYTHPQLLHVNKHQQSIPLVDPSQDPLYQAINTMRNISLNRSAKSLECKIFDQFKIQDLPERYLKGYIHKDI